MSQAPLALRKDVGVPPPLAGRGSGGGVDRSSLPGAGLPHPRPLSRQERGVWQEMLFLARCPACLSDQLEDRVDDRSRTSSLLTRIMVSPRARMMASRSASDLVTSQVAVDAAVDLDDESGGVAVEVSDVAVDDLLPPEAESGESAGPQRRPEPGLGAGHLAAHFARAVPHPLGDVLAADQDPGRQQPGRFTGLDLRHRSAPCHLTPGRANLTSGGSVTSPPSPLPPGEGGTLSHTNLIWVPPPLAGEGGQGVG